MRIFRSWFVSPYWANLPVLDFSTPRRNYARNGHSHKIPTKTTSHNLVAMTICKLDDKEHYQLTIYNNGVKSQYFHCFLKCAPADTKLLFLLVIFFGGTIGNRSQVTWSARVTCALRNPSTRDPDSATSTRFARLVYHLRLSIPDTYLQKYNCPTLRVVRIIFGGLSGIEPESKVPQTSVLTVTP